MKTRRHFACLEFIAACPELTPIFKVVLMRLGQYPADADGRIEVNYAEIAKASNASVRTAMRAVAAAEVLGLIEVKHCRGRNSKGNLFQFLTPGKNLSGLSHLDDLKCDSRRRLNVTDEVAKCDSRSHPLRKEVKEPVGPLTRPLQVERESELALGDPDCVEAAPVGACDATEETEVEIITDAEIIAPDDPEATYTELRTIWNRGFIENENADRRALAVALRTTDADDIAAGALAWREAADAPRFLPKLANWLNDRGWERPPPKRKQQAARGGAPRQQQRRSGGGIASAFADFAGSLQ